MNIPAPQPVPHLVLPPVQKGTLPNGLPLWLVEQHRNPQVVLSIVLQSGSFFDPPGKSGTASLTAELLESGTVSRDALAISESVEFIGATLGFRSGADGTFGTLLTLSRHLDVGIGLFADLLVHPVFPQREFDRLRTQRLTSLVQMKDRAASVATNAFMRVIYGDEHPYGVDPSGTEESVGGLTREDILRFYGDHYAPSDATLIVVGDTTMEEVVPLLEKEIGAWKGGESRAAPVPLPEPASPGGVYLIDKPGAPQSEIRIGRPALSRNTPDYFPVALMNRVLGGQFSSRINMNLREKRGYTYGARSSFMLLKHPGPFMVSGAFTGAKTGDAAEQLFLEIDAMHREGVTEGELEFSRKGLTGAFALSFETPYQVAAAIQNIILYGLPEDYYERYIGDLAAVTPADVSRVARTTLDTSAMALLVVADAGENRGVLGSLGRGPVVELDSGGKRLR
jgi:predicted Zn-dependent peptidase